MLPFLFAWASRVKRSFSGEGLGYVCKRAFKLLCKQELEIKDKNQRTDTQEADISLTSSSQKLQSGRHMYRTGISHMLDLSLVLILQSQVTKGQLSKLKRDSDWGCGRLGSDPHSSLFWGTFVLAGNLNGIIRWQQVLSIVSSCNERTKRLRPSRVPLYIPSKRPPVPPAAVFYHYIKLDKNAAFYPHESDHWNQVWKSKLR